MLQYKHMRHTCISKIKITLLIPLIALTVNFFAAPLMRTARAVEIETIEATASCPKGTEYKKEGFVVDQDGKPIGKRPGCAKEGTEVLVAEPTSYSCPAGYKAVEEDGKTVCKGSAEIAKVAYEAATEDLLNQAPNLKSYTSDPNVIGPCLLDPLKLMVDWQYSVFSGLSDSEKRQRLAKCLAKKTGASESDIESALGDANVSASAKKGQDAAAPLLAEIDQGEEGKPECGEQIEGLGYLICPILEHATHFSDSMWGLFEGLLTVDPLTNDTDNSIYKAWTTLRDLANVILAIVFILVIMSQISNVGISNYGIKKILPRLIIAAIAINVSYFLMQILVDVANIAGKSFDDFLSSQASMDYTNVSGWEKVMEDIIVSGGLALATIGGAAIGIATVGGPAALLFILLLIIPAILGLLAGVFALMFRSSIIPVLAIASPLAIAAWVLPNTQKLFDKWKDMFSGLLFLYPLASVYYGCLKFMAITVFLNGSSSTGQRLMALLTLSVGIFAVAIFAVKSNSIMGRMVNGIMRVANKVTAPATSAIAGYAGALAGANRGRRKAEFLAQDHSKGVADARHRGILNPFRYASRAKHAIGRQMQRNEDTINLSKIQEGAFKESTDQRLRDKILANPSMLGSAAGTVAGKAFVRDLAYKSAETELKGKYNGNAVKALYESDNGYVKALAAKEIAERNSAGEISQVREYLENGGSIDNTDMAEALMKMKSRDAGIAEAGKEAINRLEKSNGAPVHTDASEMRSFTQKGSRNLGDVQSAEQNAAAIQSGGMDWEQAARTLGDRHIMRTTPQENIGAIKASIEANITQQIQAGTMDKAQASRALRNSHAMENLSNQTKQQLQKIVSGAAQQAQASSGTQPASTSTASPPTSQPHAPAPPSAAHSASANVQPPTRQGSNASPQSAPQHTYRWSQRPPSAPPPPPPPANP